jgi:hypothetical protein
MNVESLTEEQSQLIENGRIMINFIKELLDKAIKDDPNSKGYFCCIKRELFNECKIINLEKEALINYYKEKGFEIYQEEEKFRDEIVFRLVRV